VQGCNFDLSRNIVDSGAVVAYLPDMELTHAARCLDKLGNPVRLEVFQLLVRAGRDGLSVGEIQEHLEIPGSTLSHHLSHLVNAGLVHQERESRVLRCTPNFALMEELVGFLTEQCCAGVSAPKKRRKAG